MYFVTSSVEILLTKNSHWLPFVKKEKAKFFTLISSTFQQKSIMDVVRIAKTIPAGRNLPGSSGPTA